VADVYRVFYVRLSVYVLTILKENIIIIIIGHIGDGFYGSNDPTNSVKALNEDRSKGLGFNRPRSTPPCHNNTTMQYKTATRDVR